MLLNVIFKNIKINDICDTFLIQHSNRSKVFYIYIIVDKYFSQKIHNQIYN